MTLTNDGYGGASPTATATASPSTTATPAASASPSAATTSSSAPAPLPTLPRTDGPNLGLIFALVTAGALLALCGLALLARGRRRA